MALKLSRVKAIAKKETLQVWRDPISLALAFLLPVMLLLIYGYALTFDVDNLRTVVYDRDKSSLSREFINQFSSSGYFEIVGYTDSIDSVNEYLDSGRARIAITIPENFSKYVVEGGKPAVGIFLDGSDSNTATIASGYIAAITERFLPRVRNLTIEPLIDARGRVWYNPELKSRNFLVPGLIALIMSIIIALLSSLTVAREWERGTMEQLISTPVKVPEIIIGKILPYFVIGFIDMVISVMMGIFLFDIPFRGSIALLLSLASLFLVGGVTFGVLISITSKGSQSAASQTAMLTTFLPTFILSGFIFPIYNMPKPIQLFTYLVPARYFVTILKGIFLKGSGLDVLLPEVVLLALFGLLVFRQANRKLTKRMEF